MKYAFLVAWREFAEAARTKGFWIGIFIVPMLLFISIQIPVWLETKGAPIRRFVLVDQSGEFEQAVSSGLENARQRRVFEAFNDYLRRNALPYDSNSASRAASSERGPKSLEEFVSKGGLPFHLGALKPRLKPGAQAFKEPEALFQRVELPAGVNGHWREPPRHGAALVWLSLGEPEHGVCFS